MANSVDPDQTAPIVCSGFRLFAFMLVRQTFAADDFSRRHFQMHFFLGLMDLTTNIVKYYDVASDVGVNLCNVKNCLNTSNTEIFTDKRGDLPCAHMPSCKMIR